VISAIGDLLGKAFSFSLPGADYLRGVRAGHRS
jgi:hypothetical protein